MMITSIVDSESEADDTVSTQSMKSDLFMECILPFEANAGGLGDFHGQKNHPYHYLLFGLLYKVWKKVL